jgi:dolichol-phosphate mannosyltransferase
MPEMQPTLSSIAPIMSDPSESGLVVPCYNEEDALPHFFADAIPARETMTGGRWMIVRVDDGRLVRTFELIVQKHLVDTRVTGVRLSRDSGHQPALTAGPAYATRRYVDVIECDLHDRIEALVAMYKKAIAEGLDVCYGIHTRRDAPWHLKASSRKFFAIISRVMARPWPRDPDDFSVISARCQRLILSLSEHSRILRSPRSWVAMKQASFAFQRPARLRGFSKYNIRRLALLAAQGLGEPRQ